MGSPNSDLRALRSAVGDLMNMVDYVIISQSRRNASTFSADIDLIKKDVEIRRLNKVIDEFQELVDSGRGEDGDYFSTNIEDILCKRHGKDG